MKTLQLAMSALSVALVLTVSAAAQNGRLKYLGTSSLTGDSTSTRTSGVTYHGLDVDVSFAKPEISGTLSPARRSAAHVPVVAGSPVTTSGNFSSFIGLTLLLEATANTGLPNGFNFIVEPPDQGFAVGPPVILSSGPDRYGVEAINSAISVYRTSNGARLSRKALSAFFGAAPAVLLNADGSLTFGNDFADPQVYFDADTGRFFVTATKLALDPVTGGFAQGASAHSEIFVAVSKSSDPLAVNGWNIYSIDITHDGDSLFGTCPCLGDQPLIGADKYGFYMVTNAFSLDTLRFRGAQIYAISKADLVNGVNPPKFDRLPHANQHLFVAEGVGISLQPAFVPPGGSFETANGGTEYFVQSLDFFNTLDNRLGVWALTNTSSLDTTPDLTLNLGLVQTEDYGAPPSAQQAPGPTPQADALKAHEELVASNDDRMQQVTFVAGNLWTGLNTVTKTENGVVRTGAAWFILHPSVNGNTVSATVTNQGYVAVNSPHQDSVLFPSVTANSSGQGVIGFSIVGLDLYPSAAYTRLDMTTGTGPIVLSALGGEPDDGFTGYPPFGRAGRWGDYSSASTDETGTFWLGNEFIPNPNVVPRILDANWATVITKVTP